MVSMAAAAELCLRLWSLNQTRFSNISFIQTYFLR